MIVERSSTRHRLGLSAALGLAVALSGCASHSLGFRGTTSASFLRTIEESNDPNTRYVAYNDLASPRGYDDEGQKAEAAKVLSRKLKVGREPNATRAVICRTLGILRRPEAREVILAATNDEDPLVRAEACRALGRVGRSEDATILARVMSLDVSAECRDRGHREPGRAEVDRQADHPAPRRGHGARRAGDPGGELELVEVDHRQGPGGRLDPLEEVRRRPARHRRRADLGAVGHPPRRPSPPCPRPQARRPPRPRSPEPRSTWPSPSPPCHNDPGRTAGARPVSPIREGRPGMGPSPEGREGSWTRTRWSCSSSTRCAPWWPRRRPARWARTRRSGWSRASTPARSATARPSPPRWPTRWPRASSPPSAACTTSAPRSAAPRSAACSTPRNSRRSSRP